MLVHMAKVRTTMNLDKDVSRSARESSGIQENTAQEAARRLIALGGTMPKVRAGKRRRSAKKR